MNETALTQQLTTLPTTPGIYIYKDTGGRVLYVGKAKSLRSRVNSYFRPSANLDPAKEQMVQKIASLETIRTDTENEALILEANLIRQHQPPYNVVLRDDKYYLFIKITKEEFPRVFPVRRISQDGARYFGPYSSARSVRATLRLLRRIFPHRAEKDSPHDIVFPHPLFSKTEQSGQEQTVYQQHIENIIRFLKGQRADILNTLREGMEKAAQAEHFEQASHFRDQLQAIERLEGFQKVYLPRQESFDVVSIIQQPNRSAANVFQIRAGKLLNKNTFLLRHRSSTNPEDTLRQFLLQYYSVAQDIPPTIFIPRQLEDAAALAGWMNTQHPPTIATPERGVKRQLIRMGETNAQQLLDEQDAAFTSQEKQQTAHHEFVTRLGLDPQTIHRVETYDISNIQGTLATASMVVFIDGQSTPKQYRKFRMHITGSPNDFAMVQETLRRRFAHYTEDTKWPRPDLLIIDGGKGQLSSAKKILDELHITVPVISIAKQEEEIFTPGNKVSLRLPYDSPALHLIQRMRDEAHRFTITYHRLLRSKQQKRSILDEVPGIGPKTKKRLLATFGSLKGIRQASDEELGKIVGLTKTKLLREYI